MSALDEQVGGEHYKKDGIQPFVFTHANKLDAFQHTVIKYVCRHQRKGGKQDLEKAIHVLRMYIELEYPDKTADVAEVAQRVEEVKANDTVLGEMRYPMFTPQLPQLTHLQPCTCGICKVVADANSTRPPRATRHIGRSCNDCAHRKNSAARLKPCRDCHEADERGYGKVHWRDGKFDVK